MCRGPDRHDLCWADLLVDKHHSMILNQPWLFSSVVHWLPGMIFPRWWPIRTRWNNRFISADNPKPPGSSAGLRIQSTYRQSWCINWNELIFFSFPPTQSGQSCSRAEGFCLSMWNVHVLFVPMWVFPRYSFTPCWSWIEKGGMCISSLQLCIQQPDLILLRKHVSSGFAPLLLAPSFHLWARTHNKSVQTHLQKDKSYYFLSEFEGLLRKRSVWQQNLSKSCDTNIFPIFFNYSCI